MLLLDIQEEPQIKIFTKHKEILKNELKKNDIYNFELSNKSNL